LGKIDNITPIFYVRGYNPPYTEGHIVIVRNLMKALLLQNIRSVVFNYKYHIGFQNEENNIKNCEDTGKVEFEQYIPLIDRESVFHQGIKSKIVYASLLETLGIPRFLSIEKCMRRSRRCIVNVINCFRYPRIFAKKFSTSPVILHFYTRKTIMKNTIKMLLNRVDLVITSSKSLACHLEKKYEMGKPKIQTIYPPIDTEFYKPLDKIQSRWRLGLKRSAKLVLYLGNLRKPRFPEDIVLRLMKKLVKKEPEIELLVFSPENNENLKRRMEILSKASALNLRQNVKINVKNLSEVEKRLVYSASDIFFFPSLKSREAVEPPIAVLEAMSCCLPVVSSAVTSISEVITDEVDGLITPFKAENVSYLRKQISSLLLDEKFSTVLSERARQVIIQKMSFENSCKKLLKIYETL
jgi:glycosyltransferase involved in cell wall biosynthesis